MYSVYVGGGTSWNCLTQKKGMWHETLGPGENPCPSLCGKTLCDEWDCKLFEKKCFSPKVSKSSASEKATFSFLISEKDIKVNILPLLMSLLS